MDFVWRMDDINNCRKKRINELTGEVEYLPLTVNASNTLVELEQAFNLLAPYSNNAIAVSRRVKCDYSQRITREMALSGKG